jgi:ATP:ADP antiporter, AAA family
MQDLSENSSNAKTNNALEIHSPPSKFDTLLDYIWPIEKSELPKFLFITLLMFCILGIQNLIRAMKDSVVNTMIGTETISFLKFWGVLPAAFLVTIIYVKLVSIMKGENIFYLIMCTFLSFFFLFAFFLFPNHEVMHLNPETAKHLVADYPNLKWFILLLSNWSFSIFYIVAELWPNAIFALLFWQFVNKITTVDESKRFYPLFGLLGQTGLYLSGIFLINLPFMNSYFVKIFNLSAPRSVVSIQIVISVVLILGAIGLAAFWILNNKILDIATTESLQFRVKKHQIGIKESFQMIISSRYIRLITILLFAYGVAINLVEGPWKSQASRIYKTPTEFAAFVGNYLSYTGILTIIFVLLGSNIVRRLGWLSAAIITPFMVLLTGLGFFCIANFDPVATFMMIYFSFSDPIMLAIIIGAIQNVLSKSSKYTLFDSTKEMSYVPLDEQLKTRGKAAADMIGTKLGKSTSALMQSMIFIIIPSATYTSISPLLMVIFTIICIVWIWAVIELNKEYKSACNNKETETIF